MDMRTMRTLMEINAMQTFGAVQTYAEQLNSSPSMFQLLLEEFVDDASITDSLSSVSASLLSSMQQEGLRYEGNLPVFIPSYLTGAVTKIPQNEGGTLVETGKYADIIRNAASTFDLPEKLISSIIKQESNFNNSAVSHAGAKGLMQLMPGTAKFLGVKDSFDPVQNIMGGAKYLRQMLNQFGGNLEMAIAAYNAGPGNVKKYGGIPPFKETQNYVQKVLGYFNK